MISRTNVILAVMLGGVLVLAGASGVDYSQPNVEILADSSMKYTPASTPYEPNALFGNEMTQQKPISGTIARGELPLYFAPLPHDVDPRQVDPEQVDPKDSVPGKELVNPVSFTSLLERTITQSKRDGVAQGSSTDKSELSKQATENVGLDAPDLARKASGATVAASKTAGTADDRGDSSAEKKESPDVVAQRQFQASIDRGNDFYLAFCICCHGPAGQGDGTVAQRGYPPPPSFLIGTSKQWNDGQLFYILTHGRANMPRFAAELPRDRRWDVINYIRTLQEAGNPPVDEQTGPESSTEAPKLEADAGGDVGGSIPPEEKTDSLEADAKGPA